MRTVVAASMGMLFLLCAMAAYAAPVRPRIVLVLGGGGARGIAHIGVLKVLEELNIPVDMIIGTSMGAVVGGLYAAGMSPEEIEELFNSINWDDLFDDNPSEKFLPFRNKKTAARYMHFELGVSPQGVALPRGIIAGQKLGFLLKEISLAKTPVSEFDRLPIPFRAVATDLATGAAVVIDAGSLAEAMQASMAVPGVFAPVEWRERTLVDGGLVHNLPVEVARAAGGEIIIAVDVSMPLTDPKKLKGALDVSLQSISILGQNNVDKSLLLLTDQDVILHPDMPTVQPGDFVKAPMAIAAGEAAAQMHAGVLSRYRVPAEPYREFLRRQRRGNAVRPRIDAIRVNKPSRVHPERVRSAMRLQPGDLLDEQRLFEDLSRIYAIGDFERVDYFLETDLPGGTQTLVINTAKKTWGPNYLRFGLNLVSDTASDSAFTLFSEFKMTQVNSRGGEWKNTFAFGEQRSAATEFYQPLDVRDRYFVAPFAEIAAVQENLYREDTRISEYRVRRSRGGTALGVNIGSWAEARMGVFAGRIDAHAEPDLPAFPVYETIREAAVFAKLSLDQFDNHVFPQAGTMFSLEARSFEKKLGAEYDYWTLECIGRQAVTVGGRHTFIPGIRYGRSIDGNTPFYDQFTLGGFLHLSGFSQKQLRGEHAALIDTLYYYRLGDRGILKSIHPGAAWEWGNVWPEASRIDWNDLLFSMTLFVGMDSFLGPMYIGYGKSDTRAEGRFYFILGHSF
ncbi:MAG: patatin-like phospholipase family protein [Candidatus Omnitrophica bacterium]|nr:patatin-like phospholipase family protein [Candidatus Omnitrophota bacterium]